MKTSCRFAMAVHVLAVLAYKEGDPVTSSLLAGSVNTNPVIIRRLLLSLKQARLIETFSSPSRKPNAGCPVGNCIRKTLEKVFASAEAALERDLEKTTLADVVRTARETCFGAGKGAR